MAATEAPVAAPCVAEAAAPCPTTCHVTAVPTRAPALRGMSREVTLDFGNTGETGADSSIISDAFNASALSRKFNAMVVRNVFCGDDHASTSQRLVALASWIEMNKHLNYVNINASSNCFKEVMAEGTYVAAAHAWRACISHADWNKTAFCVSGHVYGHASWPVASVFPTQYLAHR